MNPPHLSATVHVVDDDPSMLGALVRVLSAVGYTARGYRSANEALAADIDEPRHEHASCFVLDMIMPGVDGLGLQAALEMRATPPQVVFVTGYGDVSSTVKAMRAGAVDVLTKPVPQDRLVAAVGRALVRDHEACLVQAQMRALRTRYDRLTLRERDVYERVAQGELNKQIAVNLGMAERTVKWHRAQIMDKLQAGSLADLVRMSRHLPPFSED